MADRLIVTGLGRMDGEYEFEAMDIVLEGRPGSLTTTECHHTVKRMCGLRADEVLDAFVHNDEGFLAALAAVLIQRAGKTVDEGALWASKQGSGAVWDGELGVHLKWDVAWLNQSEEEEDESPPAEPAATPEAEAHDKSGGTSSSPTLVSPASAQSSTGLPDSGRSATYDHLTSVG